MEKKDTTNSILCLFDNPKIFMLGWMPTDVFLFSQTEHKSIQLMGRFAQNFNFGNMI
jgi:hypothetical protein